MARPATVDKDVHTRVSTQVSRLLATSEPSLTRLKMQSLLETAVESELGLATCLDVWSLPLTGVFAEKGELRDVAQDNHRWHHQVVTKGKAIGFARSNSAPGDDYGAVTELFEADVAHSIDRAITVIDAEDPDSDAEVRLLLVPGLRITALWLAESDPTKDRIVVVAGRGANLHRKPQLISAREFMARLRRFPHAREMVRPELLEGR